MPVVSQPGGPTAGTVGSFGFASRTLTATQIKALHATPITLAAAPGAGKAFRILQWGGQAFPGGTPYTAAGGDERIQIGAHDEVVNDYSPWETTNGAASLAVLNGTGGGTETCWIVALNETGASSASVPPAFITNQALVVGNPGTEYAAGNGTLYLWVAFVIVTVG